MCVCVGGGGGGYFVLHTHTHTRQTRLVALCFTSCATKKLTSIHQFKVYRLIKLEGSTNQLNVSNHKTNYQYLSLMDQQFNIQI